MTGASARTGPHPVPRALDECRASAEAEPASRATALIGRDGEGREHPGPAGATSFEYRVPFAANTSFERGQRHQIIETSPKCRPRLTPVPPCPRRILSRRFDRPEIGRRRRSASTRNSERSVRSSPRQRTSQVGLAIGAKSSSPVPPTPIKPRKLRPCQRWPSHLPVAPCAIRVRQEEVRMEAAVHLHAGVPRGVWPQAGDGPDRRPTVCRAPCPPCPPLCPPTRCKQT